MKRQIDYTIPALAIPLLIAFLVNLPGCYSDKKIEDKKPVYVEYFKNGDILLPDYAVQDTVIVYDAKGMNEEMAWLEQGLKDGTDKDYADITYRHCYVISFK